MNEQLTDDEYRRRNRICRVCKSYQYDEGDLNQICYYCRQSIRLRKEEAAAAEEQWKTDHPLQNTLRNLFIYGTLILIAYWVFVLPVTDFIDELHNPTPQNKSNPTFYGYPCTGDCSGHEAGYKWAEENNVIDPSDCIGKSESFIEGCTARTEMNW